MVLKSHFILEVEWERILSCYFGFFVCFFEAGFCYESLAGLRFTDTCLPLPPKCWDSKRVSPCLAALCLSPSPVLHAHHRSQTTHTDGLSWPLLPRCASPVVAVLKRLGLDCLCFAVCEEREDSSIVCVSV